MANLAHHKEARELAAPAVAWVDGNRSLVSLLANGTPTPAIRAPLKVQDQQGFQVASLHYRLRSISTQRVSGQVFHAKL